MDRLTTIELAKEYLKFSVAHFTIFSSTERERLHGHNFSVSAEIDAPVNDNGLCFSYAEFKKKLELLCSELDEYLVLPNLSPHLVINHQQDEYVVEFNGEKMRFLVADTLLLPIRNSTVEEFADYLLQQLLEDADIVNYDIRRVLIKVSSGPGQWGSSEWNKDTNAMRKDHIKVVL